MRAKEIMNAFVVRLKPETTVQTAVEAMASEGVGIVCVCDNRGVPLGVVTDRDVVLRACAKGLPLGTTLLRSIMTKDLLTCQLDDQMCDVETRMEKRSIARVLVVNEVGTLEGLVSLAEIWHYESPLEAGAMSRRVTEREFRAHTPGGHFMVGREGASEADCAPGQREH